MSTNEEYSIALESRKLFKQLGPDRPEGGQGISMAYLLQRQLYRQLQPHSPAYQVCSTSIPAWESLSWGSGGPGARTAAPDRLGMATGERALADGQYPCHSPAVILILYWSGGDADLPRELGLCNIPLISCMAGSCMPVASVSAPLSGDFVRGPRR